VRVRIALAAAGLALAATPWLTWYTGLDDGGPYSDDGWMAFKGISVLVVAAGLAGIAVAAVPALWRRLPRVASRLPTLLAAIAAVAVARHIATGPTTAGRRTRQPRSTWRRCLQRQSRRAASWSARASRNLAIVATADLTVLALGRAGVSASEYIAEIQRRLAAQQRVRYRMHAMGTSLEGSTEDILAVVGELHAVPFDQGVPRVYTVLKLDERRDRPDQTLDDKVRSVEERLAGD
jgi:uncharacterized protein (TIGR00106 family)